MADGGGSGAVEVSEEPARSRFTVTVDGRPAGTAAYELREGAVAFTHTEVDPAYEGRGVGSALVRGALDRVRARDQQILAECPFVAAYVQRHPEYGDLLAG